MSAFDALYSLNIYNLALYDDSELGKEIKHTDDDLNELGRELSESEPLFIQCVTDMFYQEIFKAGIAIIS